MGLLHLCLTCSTFRPERGTYMKIEIKKAFTNKKTAIIAGTALLAACLGVYVSGPLPYQVASTSKVQVATPNNSSQESDAPEPAQATGAADGKNTVTPTSSQNTPTQQQAEESPAAPANSAPAAPVVTLTSSQHVLCADGLHPNDDYWKAAINGYSDGSTKVTDENGNVTTKNCQHVGTW